MYNRVVWHEHTWIPHSAMKTHFTQQSLLVSTTKVIWQSYSLSFWRRWPFGFKARQLVWQPSVVWQLFIILFMSAHGYAGTHDGSYGIKLRYHPR